MGTLKKERYEKALSPWPVKLSSSKSKGRFVKATTFIPAGTTVIDELGTGFALLRENQNSHCNLCLKPLEGLEYSCKSCIKQTYYCSTVCQNSDAKRHAHECKIIKELSGISAMHSVEYTLLRCLVSTLAQRASEISADVLSIEKLHQSDLNQSEERTVFWYLEQLVSHRKSMSEIWLGAIEKGALDIAELVSSELAEAICHKEAPSLHEIQSAIITLACQINSNSHGIADPHANLQSDSDSPAPSEIVSPTHSNVKVPIPSTTTHAGNAVIGVGIFPICAMVNHSCIPNCAFVSFPGKSARMVVRTIRDVAVGEELTLPYVDLYLPKEERRGKLLETKHFWCCCKRCESSNQDINLEQFDVVPKCIAEVDGFIEGVICMRCEKLVEEKECDCGYSLSSGLVMDCLKQFEAVIDSAMEFVSSRQPTFAIRQFCDAFTAFYKRNHVENSNQVPIRLHPNHHLIFNSLVPFMNCALRLGRLKVACWCVEEIIGILERSGTVPSDKNTVNTGVWPEIADYYLHLGETLEIYGHSALQGLEVCGEKYEESFIKMVMSDDKSKSDEEIVLECFVKAKNAFRCCYEIRRVVYGEDQGKTREALEQFGRFKEF